MKFRTLFPSAVCLALTAVNALASQPIRLFEIFAQRAIDDDGTPIFEFGRLNARGEFTHDIYVQISPGTIVPPAAMNQNLVPSVMLLGYDALGSEALVNFKFGGKFLIGGQGYLELSAVDQPNIDIGTLANISARGVITPGGEPLIGGFVVLDHPRQVLVRGVGPSLGAFGVATPLADPVIRVFRQGEAMEFASNDDWGQQANVDQVETAATAVSAFPIARSSKDAALLLELPAGVYTVHLGTNGATGGTALLEIYVTP